MCDGRAEGGAAASLRKQLKAKDMELRQVQRRMAQWKEQTAARLACKFEEELTSELERCDAESQFQSNLSHIILPVNMGCSNVCCPTGAR